MQKIRYISDIITDVRTQASDVGYTINLNNMTVNTAEILADSDGMKPVIKAMRAHIRCKSGDVEEQFTVQPVVVQTAGTFTESVDLDGNNVADLLDPCIDDEFGFQKLGDLRMSKFGVGQPANPNSIVETTINIPQNIINLLNKEVSTERLQSLYLALVGKQQTVTSVMNTKCVISVDYFKKTKGITIR